MGDIVILPPADKKPPPPYVAEINAIEARKMRQLFIGVFWLFVSVLFLAVRVKLNGLAENKRG